MADPTIIDAGTRIDGRIAGDADVTVHGRVDGEIELTETLTVDDGGFVRGQIGVRQAHIIGAVEGDIVAQERIFLAASARVVGSLEAPAIEIADGARFAGEVVMDLEGAAPAPSTSRTSSARSGAQRTSATTSRARSPEGATTRPYDGATTRPYSAEATRPVEAQSATTTTTTTVVEEEEEPEEAGEPDVTDMSKRELQDLTVKELREELRERDLQVSGTKDELIERLQNAGED